MKGQIAASIGIDNRRVQRREDMLAPATPSLCVHGVVLHEYDDFRAFAVGDQSRPLALPGIRVFVGDQSKTGVLNDSGALDSGLLAFQNGLVRGC